MALAVNLFFPWVRVNFYGNKRSADELDDLLEERLLQGDSDVWVLGDSIPFWAGKRAADSGNHNLHLTCTIAWWCEQGLRWKDLRRSIQAQVLLSSAPSIVIINLGGNDLINVSVNDLERIMKFQIYYL